MCGRYFIDESFAETLKGVTGCPVSSAEMPGENTEVFPTDKVPILCRADGAVQAVRAIWGYPHWEKKNVLINARAESALERRMFRDSVEHCRCVVPVSGYYEWNAAKVRHQFTKAGEPLMFLAGIYQWPPESLRFVILTTEANPSVVAVHHRMPLVLEYQELDMWLADSEAYKRILKKHPPELICEPDNKKNTDYEQLSLFE